MKKKHLQRILTVAICCVLLGIILCFVPWPTRIDMEMSCAEVNQNGDIVTEGTVSIQGWQQNYLFKHDKIILESIKFPGISAPINTPSGTPLTLSEEIDPHAAFGIVWNGNAFRSIYISLQDNWATCLIRLNGDRYFACSLDNAFEVAEILEIHKWILD